MSTLYETRTYPEHWVVRDQHDKLWLVPAVADGWQQRTPYQGETKNLTRVNPMYAISVGIPDLVSEPAGQNNK